MSKKKINTKVIIKIYNLLIVIINLLINLNTHLQYFNFNFVT